MIHLAENIKIIRDEFIQHGVNKNSQVSLLLAINVRDKIINFITSYLTFN